MAQFFTNSFFIWQNIWISLKAILYLIRLPNWNSEASTYLPIYSKEIFFVNFSFFAKNVPIFIVFCEKFQTRKMCSTTEFQTKTESTTNLLFRLFFAKLPQNWHWFTQDSSGLSKTFCHSVYYLRRPTKKQSLQS